jgi:thioredoxin-dependent peroxiredoxin
VLFSHPKNFTPVCTTELGTMAMLDDDSSRRGVQVIGLSVDPVERHADWAKDIEKAQGRALNYPIIGDADFTVSKLYDMLPASTVGDPLCRTPADPDGPQRLRDRAGQEDHAVAGLSDDDRGNFDEVLRVIESLQLTANHEVATPANWTQGRTPSSRLGLRRGGEADVPRRVGDPLPYMRVECPAQPPVAIGCADRGTPRGLSAPREEGEVC